MMKAGAGDKGPQGGLTQKGSDGAMATFTVYAEILTPDHTQYKAYKAGIKKNPPGQLLQDILTKTGGVYEVDFPLSERFREEIRQVAELTSDAELLNIASLPSVPVPLEHLRGADPRTTRIVLGHELTYTAEESERLGLRHEGPYDPRNTIIVDS
jgi:hypothetical protein